MRRVSAAAVLLIARLAGAADFGGGAAGSSAASFLEMGVGARALGLGDAYGALSDDALALFWNPAALTEIPPGSAAIMHAPSLAGSFLDGAAYGRNLGARGAVAVGLEYFSAGTLAQTDLSGSDLGAFQPEDAAFSAGYAWKTQGCSFGLAGKYVRSRVVGSAQTGAADLGMLTPYYAGRVRFAFTATNLGGRLKFEAESERLPLALRAASAWRLAPGWLAGLDAVLPQGNRAYLSAGTEYLLGAGSAWSLALRAGVNTRARGETGGFSGVSLGAGVMSGRFSFDYGFLPMGALGLTHRLGASWRWGSVDTLKRVL